MLKFGNKEFRNLQEQVLKNMQDIQNIMQGTAVLDEFGIKVVGQVASVPDMPTVEEYKEDNPDWAYGDAYAIGEDSPYTLKILTRGSNGGDDYWFNIGEFPAPGPQGETGPQGPVGPQGPTGPSGTDGAAAGFGTITATAQTLVPGSSATATVVASGPNTAKNLAFTFGIPQGEPGSGGGGDVTDVKVNGVSVVDEDGVAAITVPTNYVTTDTQQTISASKTFANPVEFSTMDVTYGNGTVTTIPGTIRTDKTNSYGVNIPSTSSFAANKTLATTDQIPSLTGYATETWVTNQGYITGIDSSDVISALGYTPGTSNFSGSYTDLTDKPTIPTDTSDLTNNAGFITSAALSGYATETWVGNQGYLTSVSWNDVSSKPTFATVATSGDYDDLLNKPTIPAAQVQSDWTEADNTKVDYIKNKPSLATVATSGDYGDLLNKPTIPAAQVNSDWDAVSGVAQILNKPSLATVATSGSYADLTNKPTIPSVSGTYTGSNWDTITIDGTTKNVGGGSVTDVEVDNVSVVTSGIAELTTETWTFTLSDNTTITKKILVG